MPEIIQLAIIFFFFQNQLLPGNRIKSENMETQSSYGDLDESSSRDLLLETGSSDSFESSTAPSLHHQLCHQMLTNDSIQDDSSNSHHHLSETGSIDDNFPATQLDVNDKLYRCDVCYKLFRGLQHLSVHKLKTHKDDKQCESRVHKNKKQQSFTLSKHKLEYSGVKKYQCDDMY